jgi:hypothetical protein
MFPTVKKRKQVYWNPLGEEADQVVVLNGQYYLGKPNCRAVWFDQVGFLSGLGTDEMLMIDGHSNGLPKLSATAKGDGFSVDYKNLALWIKDYGNLPSGHLLIKLIGCETFFCAQMLSGELAPHYPNIVVGGYLHSVVHGMGAKNRAFILGGVNKFNTTGSGYVKWYQNGKPCEKPDLPKYDYQDK